MRDNIKNVENKNLFVVTHNPATALSDDCHIVATVYIGSEMHNGCR